MKVRVFIWFVPLSGVGHMCCCYVCAGVNARTTGRSSDERASSLGYTGNLPALDKESERFSGVENSGRSVDAEGRAARSRTLCELVNRATMQLFR